MWQRFLARYVPVMQDLPSTLDRADGVGLTHPHPLDAANGLRPHPAALRALTPS